MDKDSVFLKNAVLHKQCYNCALNKKCMQDDPYFEPIGTCSKWTEFIKEEQLWNEKNK